MVVIFKRSSPDRHPACHPHPVHRHYRRHHRHPTATVAAAAADYRIASSCQPRPVRPLAPCRSWESASGRTAQYSAS